MDQSHYYYIYYTLITCTYTSLGLNYINLFVACMMGRVLGMYTYMHLVAPGLVNFTCPGHADKC